MDMGLSFSLHKFKECNYAETDENNIIRCANNCGKKCILVLDRDCAIEDCKESECCEPHLKL